MTPISRQHGCCCCCCSCYCQKLADTQTVPILSLLQLAERQCRVRALPRVLMLLMLMSPPMLLLPILLALLLLLMVMGVRL